ncbi:hypothetical protein BJX63DRAFT_217060 [Aspergillus granulosus]|uniref:Uncharacterized protein n=1 Tax=Aspergillus granulosus TaxID=176169 RepID=A0ABR4HDP8_9EURO
MKCHSRFVEYSLGLCYCIFAPIVVYISNQRDRNSKTASELSYNYITSEQSSYGR